MRKAILLCALLPMSAASALAAPSEVFPRLDSQATRREPITDPMLTIALEEKRATQRRSEFADSLAGGPDFWEVKGAAAKGLSLREEASPRAKLVAHLPNGTVLKNLGCKNRGAKRWCKVERPDDPSARGWVEGRYLRESAGVR